MNIIIMSARVVTALKMIPQEGVEDCRTRARGIWV